MLLLLLTSSPLARPTENRTGAKLLEDAAGGARDQPEEIRLRLGRKPLGEVRSIFQVSTRDRHEALHERTPRQIGVVGLCEPG